jgi:hypothetical protein
MFDQLFVRSGALTCELSAPLLDERRQYLTHCAVQGNDEVHSKSCGSAWISAPLGTPRNSPADGVASRAVTWLPGPNRRPKGWAGRSGRTIEDRAFERSTVNP